tara:strand:+ start:97 stop:417 length:321 start_codon:yes stop_codon:yes gene_type:complete
MNRAHSQKAERRLDLVQWGALVWLLILAGLAFAGPYGGLAWAENLAVLHDREDRIATLKEEQAVLANRVELLDPDNVDPDLGSELVRRNLGVAHPDEYVIELENLQ